MERVVLKARVRLRTHRMEEDRKLTMAPENCNVKWPLTGQPKCFIFHIEKYRFKILKYCDITRYQFLE